MRNPDVWPQLTSGSERRGQRRGKISRQLRVQETERCRGDGGGPLVRTYRVGGVSHRECCKMAAAQAVEEMRTRVVLGEFGVRNVSADRSSGGMGLGQEEGGGLLCGLASLPFRGQISSLCSRFIPRTFPVTTLAMMMPGTRTASRR